MEIRKRQVNSKESSELTEEEKSKLKGIKLGKYGNNWIDAINDGCKAIGLDAKAVQGKYQPYIADFLAQFDFTDTPADKIYHIAKFLSSNAHESYVNTLDTLKVGDKTINNPSLEIIHRNMSGPWGNKSVYEIYLHGDGINSAVMKGLDKEYPEETAYGYDDFSGTEEDNSIYITLDPAEYKSYFKKAKLSKEEISKIKGLYKEFLKEAERGDIKSVEVPLGAFCESPIMDGLTINGITWAGDKKSTAEQSDGTQSQMKPEEIQSQITSDDLFRKCLDDMGVASSDSDAIAKLLSEHGSAKATLAWYRKSGEKKYLPQLSAIAIWDYYPPHIDPHRKKNSRVIDLRTRKL